MFSVGVVCNALSFGTVVLGSTPAWISMPQVLKHVYLAEVAYLRGPLHRDPAAPHDPTPFAQLDLNFF